MNNFYHNLEYNYQKILEICRDTSGTKSINIEKSENWINSQLTLRRQNAARNLFNSIRYITLEETINYINNLIDMYYEEISINDVYIFLNDKYKNKSNFFINIIGIHRILERGFKQPIIIDNIEEYFHLFENNHLLLLDDMMYSGSQMGSFLEKLTVKSILDNLNINVSVFVVGSTEYAMKRNIKIKLDHFSIKQISKLKNINYRDVPIYGDNNFNIRYGFIEKNIYDLITIDEYLDILYFFSPFTYGNPHCCVYFDHKIADSISTFLTVLLHGPILPSKLYTELNNGDYIYESFMRNINLIMSSYSISISDARMYITDYIKNMQYDENCINDELLSFSPFINNLEHVDNNIFISLPYYLFCVNDTFIENYGEDEDDNYNNYNNDDDEIYNNIKLYYNNIKNIYENEVRHNISWYKKNILK